MSGYFSGSAFEARLAAEAGVKAYDAVLRMNKLIVNASDWDLRFPHMVWDLRSPLI
jgi:hypothetical protein